MATKVYLDTDDVTDYLSSLAETPANKKASYNALSTICIGKDGTNYVLKNFKMHEDLLANVFDDCTLKTLGVTVANSQYYGLSPAATPVVTRVSNASITKITKGGTGRSFSGRRVRFPIPAAQATGLRKYFGQAAARKTATIVFPNIATLPQIAMWFLTHLPTARQTSIPHFWMPSGTKVLMPSYPAALAAFDAQVGEFSAGTKAKLPDDKEVAEATP